MPFRVCNALWTFQPTMDVILSPVQCQFDLKYLDGIIIFSCTAEEHIEHVHTKLPLLHRAGVMLSRTGDSPGSIGTHYFHFGRSTQLSTTSTSNGAPVILGFMRCTPTLRSQIRRSCCSTQHQAEKGNSNKSKPCCLSKWSLKWNYSTTS